MESRASRPWLTESIPYMSKESANDICLKKDGLLCVIYVVPQASQSDRSVVQALEWVKDYFSAKVERGITFSFMRLDASKEPNFASIFEF